MRTRRRVAEFPPTEARNLGVFAAFRTLVPEIGFGMAGEIDRYRQYASDCLRIAQQAGDDVQKARLLEMAVAWKRLADAAPKNHK
jgi:hypothetical protein